MRNDDESQICPSCLTKNETKIDFCSNCGRPLGDYVTYDPIKRNWTQGWMYRRLVSRPSSPIVFYGMWLFFGLPFIGLVLMIPCTPIMFFVLIPML